MLRLNIGVGGGGNTYKTHKRKCLPVRKEDLHLKHIQSIKIVH